MSESSGNKYKFKVVSKIDCTFKTSEGENMDDPEAVKFFESVGALLTGDHIRYVSGRHGSTYFRKYFIYPHATKTSEMCRRLAKRLLPLVGNIEVVVAPAMGGLVLSHSVAHHLSLLQGKEVLAFFAEKDKKGNFIFKNDYDKMVSGMRVLVVEDTVNTGGSVRKVIKLVRECKGNVVGLGTLCNRGLSLSDLEGVPIHESLVNLQLDSYAKKDCPLCKKGIPLNKNLGHPK